MPPAAPELGQLVESAVQADDTPVPDDLRSYQSIVGALLYASTHTRPDIALAVSLLSRAMSRPTPQLYAAALRVVCYLHRHRDIGLRYTPTTQPLRGYSDSDWATRHSTFGFVFLYSTAAISWGSKKQATIALSSCEAEIVAASESAKEAIHLSRFFGELGVAGDEPVELAVDNQSAIHCAYNDEQHKRMKHIERRHFFVRECVENHQIRVPFVRSVDNLADFFTKPLPASVFFPMRDLIMNVTDAASVSAGTVARVCPCHVHGGDCVQSASSGVVPT